MRPRGGRKFSLLEAGALRFAPIPGFSRQFSSCHRLASASTTQDRGYERGEGNQGKTLAFLRSHRVFQRTTGRHNEERRSKACVILIVVSRGERRRTGSGAPEPHAGPSETPLPPSPGLPRAGRCRGHGCARNFVRWRLLGQNNWRGGAVRSLFGAAPGAMSPALRSPRPPTEGAASIGPKQQELGRPGRKQRGKREERRGPGDRGKPAFCRARTFETHF